MSYLACGLSLPSWLTLSWLALSCASPAASASPGGSTGDKSPTTTIMHTIPTTTVRARRKYLIIFRLKIFTLYRLTWREDGLAVVSTHFECYLLNHPNQDNATR